MPVRADFVPVPVPVPETSRVSASRTPIKPVVTTHTIPTSLPPPKRGTGTGTGTGT